MVPGTANRRSVTMPQREGAGVARTYERPCSIYRRVPLTGGGRRLYGTRTRIPCVGGRTVARGNANCRAKKSERPCCPTFFRVSAGRSPTHKLFVHPLGTENRSRWLAICALTNGELRQGTAMLRGNQIKKRSRTMSTPLLLVVRVGARSDAVRRGGRSLQIARATGRS